MRISASEFILFCHPPLENARRLHEIVPEVELMMDGDAWEHGEQGWPDLAARLKGCGIPFSVHPPAWDVNAAAPLRALRDAAAFLNLQALSFCREIGGTQIVYHPGYYDRDSNFSRSRALDASYALLDEMIAAARGTGITIAYENIAGPSMALFTQEEFIHALDGIDPCVRFLLDLGHAHCNHWDIPAVIDRIGDRLCGFHLHDNDGTGDAHLPIGQGTIPWDAVFAAMRGLPGDPLYVLEYATNTPLRELELGRDLLLREIGDLQL